jgi:hypothetical protein
VVTINPPVMTRLAVISQWLRSRPQRSNLRQRFKQRAGEHRRSSAIQLFVDANARRAGVNRPSFLVSGVRA